MTPSTALAWRKSVAWIALAIVSVTILLFRLQLSFDLSAFLPRNSNLTHEVLLEQFSNGPGSRLVVIGINGADRATLEDSSDELKRTLGEISVFRSVSNGDAADESGAIPEPINSYFLLMRDIDYSKAAFDDVAQARLHDLAIGGGSALLNLVARDPHLVSLDILQRLTPFESSGDIWFAEDGSAVILAETRSAAIDIGEQAQAIAAVHSAFGKISGSDGLSLEITGVGAFSVELQKTIQAEAQKLSILASLAVMLVLIVVFRRPRYLLLAALPLGMGFLLGLTAVTVIFSSVHGITLAFGFTLIGVAIDYPLHLFSHSQDTKSATAIDRIWPTLRLGAISTAVAYLALAFSASDGLAQLGVFSASGVITAALVTRFWLPFLISNGATDVRSESANVARAEPVFLPAIIILAVVLAVAKFSLQDEFWDDNVASLSPVPAARLQTDGMLRSAAGSSEMRYLIMLRNESFDELLQHTERLDEFMSAAVTDGMLESWQSLTNLLPSSAVIQSRLASIPDRDSLRALVADSIASTPFRANAFDPFIDAAAALGEMPELSAERFINSPLQPWLDAHLMKIGSTWVSLISLSNPDVDALRANSGDWGQGAELLDMRDSSMNMMQDYRSNAIGAVSLAAVLIFGILWMQRRNLRQVVWIVTTVSVALAATILSVALVHGQLTVVHLVALLLVAGLGLDYALFFSRRESAEERKHTVRAVMACAISTTLAFAILATSAIPVLKFMGLTVAIGSLASYLLAAASFKSIER